MAAGEGLSPRELDRIDRALERCRKDNGLDVTVLVGDLEIEDLGQFRAASERLHAALGDRSRGAVLLVVAPGQRRVEIVTGPAARRRVPDRVSALAVLSMTSAFRRGDLAGGILDAVRQIADAAGPSAPLEIESAGAQGAAGGHGAHGPRTAEVAVPQGH